MFSRTVAEKSSGVLQHHADLAAQRLERHVAHVDAVDEDAARRRRRRSAGIRLMRVLLPEPVGPTSAITCPGWRPS